MDESATVEMAVELIKYTTITNIKTINEALHGIGVKVTRDFRFRHVFSIHTLCSGARPPREL